MKVRRAIREDCGLIWVWANDPVVRQNSFEPRMIHWQEHVDWFHGKLLNDNCYFYIITAEGDPIAQARFDVSGSAEISVSISSAWRGFGLGAEVIRLASKESRLPRIQARIKTGNIASVKAFTKAGYAETGMTEVKGQKAIVMVLDEG